MFKEDRGVTLIALGVTIIILIILAGIASYSGITNIKDSKVANVKAQLRVMQTMVNSWYQEFENGNTNVLEYGSSDISNYSEVFNTAGITDTSGYRLFTSKYIKDDLDIDGISYDMLINIKNRNIILTKGVKGDDKMYYDLEDFGISNVNNE